MGRLSIIGALVFLPAALRLAPAQSTSPEDLAGGKLLVASRDLSDPNFAKSVVLLVKYDDDGVLGLIINRRSKVAISHVLDDLAGAKERTDLVYSGGPVQSDQVMALLRAHSKPDDSDHVVGDVYLVPSKDALEKALSSAAESSLRVYVGYAGWSVGQLEHEVDLGAWYIFRGDPATVFDSEPDSIWPRLIRQTELQIASARVHQR